MDAAPFLAGISRRLDAVGLEAILIGNAAAALHGAPVTTIDFDVLFRKTPRNLQTLEAFARALDATILRPYYPVSDFFRVVRDDGLQADFMGTIHGVRSFGGLRERSSLTTVDDAVLRVAALSDIVKSKKAAGRPRDRAVLEVLERTLEAQDTRQPSPAPRRSEARKRS